MPSDRDGGGLKLIKTKKEISMSLISIEKTAEIISD